MHKVAQLFAAARGGSFAPIVAIAAVPLLLGVGLVVDYSSAMRTRTAMQNALDVALLAAVTQPKATKDSERQTILTERYAANGGEGAPKLTLFEITPQGAANASATAEYSMPTMFMGLAKINAVSVGVKSAVTKSPRLVEAAFKIVKVSGWWNKTMTLYGTKRGESTARRLMQIDYAYNGAGDPKGYGTTTAYTVTNKGKGQETLKQVQQQVCATATVQSFANLPAGAITGSGGGKLFVTTCATSPGNGKGAVIDVSEMESLYLEMNVPSGNPKVLRSNDPTTSDRLYIEDKEVAKGEPIDIFTAVGCSETGTQAWEDGGSPVPAPVVNADFFYSVSGKCDFSDLSALTRLTE